jgi:polo-like kinase 1
MSKNPNQQGNPTENAQTIVEEKVVKYNGEICIKRYLKGKFLGKGGFARCFEFTNLENKRLSAAKIIQKSTLTKTRAKQKLMSEIKIHRSLHHNNIVGFEHFFEDAENVYILLELCQNQSLNELLRRRKRLHELEVQCYVNQLCSAMKYLHSHRVIHRDLKLGNLFLNEKMEVKVGDFGLATKLEFDGERKRTICGTPNYIAPEVLEGKQGHSYEVDTWSLGVIIYTLIIGKPPFETSDVKTTYKRIRMNAYNFPENVPITDYARDIITKILNNDPAKRPSIDEILAHEWINHAGTIPRLLPASTLACPPSSTYIRQFVPNPSMRSKDMVGGPSATAPHAIRSNDLNSQRRPGDQAMTAQQTMKNNQMTPSATQPKDNEVWVKKWVDYASKYGLGYCLSNEAIGVFFNDSTKICLDPNGFHFDYMERRSADRQDVGKEYNLSEYPKDLQKKVTLLQHFRSYLEGTEKPNPNAGISEDVQKRARRVTDVVYVKKWMRTRHAIMFRLSNKVVQVNFQDHTEIMLSSETKVVTYVNKRGERSTYPLNSAMESANLEMVKRLKYTKDILTHMLNQNAGNLNRQQVKSAANG